MQGATATVVHCDLAYQVTIIISWSPFGLAINGGHFFFWASAVIPSLQANAFQMHLSSKYYATLFLLHLLVTGVQAQLFLQEIPQGALAATANTNLASTHTRIGMSNGAQLVHGNAGHQAFVGAALPYAFTDWQSLGLDYGYVTENQAFGIHLAHQQVPAYQESALLLRYGRRFNQKLSIGLGLGYQLAQAQEYGNTSAPAFEVAALQQLNDKLSFGLALTNLGQVKASGIETLSQIKIGLAWKASSDFEITAEARKDLLRQIEYALGANYKATDKLLFLGGIRSGGSARASFGFGLTIAPTLRLDGSAVWHPVLGFTPGIGLRFGR